MDANFTGKLIVLSCLAGASFAEQPPRPFPMSGPPQPMHGQAPLEQPGTVQPGSLRVGVRQAFELQREPQVPAPMQQTSASQPTGAALNALQAEAARLVGRGRSVSDLTDLIERCEQRTELGQHLSQLTAWAYNRRGELQMDAGNARAAYEDFQHAVVLDQQNAAALNNRGIVLAQHGEQQAALADFTAAIQQQPDNPIYRRNRAELQTARGRYEAALQDYQTALQNSPEDSTLLAGRGFCFSALGEINRAVRDYNQALSIAPNDAATLALRGSLYASAGYYEQASTDLSAALAADPTHGSAYQSAAWLLATCPDQRFRDGAKALEAAKRAMQFGLQDDPVLLDVAAAAYASAGLHQEAIRLAQQAALAAPVELRPQIESRLARYQSGQAHIEPQRKVRQR